MTYTHLPSTLPITLRAAGLKVVEIDGWHGRGRPSSTGGFDPVGVLCHHTGSYDSMTDATNDREYARWLAVTGRSDLPAPLCNLALSAEGVVYACASGRANHAGTAKASGTVAAGDGNELYIGIEAMNSGSQGWSKAQYDAYVTLCAVLSVKVTGNSVQTVRGHKETSVTGKWDPGQLDMGEFRADVAAKMKALTTPPPPPVTTHTRWAIRTTGVHETPGGTKLRDIPPGYSFQVIDGSGHGNDGWIETSAGNWVLGADTTIWDPAAPVPFSVMDWNVENKGDADAALDRAEIIKLVEAEKPTYFCLQEVYRVDLQDIPGYQTYHPFEGYPVDSENRAQAILVRDDVALKIKQALAMEEEWIGPKMGIRHDPRVHRYVTGNIHDTNIPVATFHVPFGTAAVEETRLAAIAWAQKMEAAHGVAVIAGDWNSLADDLQAKVGTPAGATVDGGGKDKFVFLGCKKVGSKNLGNRGRSDHPVKKLDFEA